MSATIKKLKINDVDVPVIFEKYSSLPIFNLQLVFKNSGYINDGDKPGLTSLTAQLLNEGTLKDGAVNFSRKLENKAISIHTSNGFETLVIELSSLKDESSNSITLLKKLLNNPNVTQKTLDKLKTLQISKIKQKENDFDYMANIELKKLMFKNTALEYPSSGTVKSLNEITLKDVQNQLNNIFNLNNLIIVAGGDISFKDISKKITPILETFKKQATKKVTTIAVNKNIKTKTILKDTKQAYIYFGSRFNLDSNSKNNYKAKVASFILGGSGFGSRLMEEIRVKRGLAYSAYGNISIKKSNSTFTGYLQTKTSKANEAKKLVKKLIKEFIDNGVTKNELDAAKQFILGSQPLRTETFAQRQSRAFSLFYKGLPLSYPKEELKLIENLTLKDLNQFVKKHDEISDLFFSIVTK